MFSNKKYKRFIVKLFIIERKQIGKKPVPGLK